MAYRQSWRLADVIRNITGKLDPRQSTVWTLKPQVEPCHGLGKLQPASGSSWHQAAKTDESRTRSLPVMTPARINCQTTPMKNSKKGQMPSCRRRVQ
jgi:hypothetical protein